MVRLRINIFLFFFFVCSGVASASVLYSENFNNLSLGNATDANSNGWKFTGYAAASGGRIVTEAGSKALQVNVTNAGGSVFGYYNLTSIQSSFTNGTKVTMKIRNPTTNFDWAGYCLQSATGAANSGAGSQYRLYGCLFGGADSATNLQALDNDRTSHNVIVGFSTSAQYLLTFNEDSFGGNTANVTVNDSSYRVTTNITDPNATSQLLINLWVSGGAGVQLVIIDDVCVYNGATNYSDCFTTPTVSNFSLTASNLINGSSLTTFNATINGTVYNSSGGTINTNINTTSGKVNITVKAEGYHDLYFLNWNVSSNVVANLTPLVYYGASFGSPVVFGGTNYARNLTYSINLSCSSSGYASILFIYNATLNSTTAATCNNASATYTGTLRFSEERSYNVSVYVNVSTNIRNDLFNATIFSQNYFIDLYAPNATLTHSNINNFSATPTINLTLRCDDIFTNITYNLSHNNNLLFFGNKTSGSVQENASTVTDGTQTARGSCADPWSITTTTQSFTIYVRNILLVDERTGAPFNASNVSSARAWFDDNSTFYDFKTTATNNVTLITNTTSKIRVELRYSTGDVIVRFLDVGLFSTSQIKVCANTEGVTHYSILVYSATERAVLISNTFTKCFIAGDYTRFAYQDTKILRAHTIDSNYNLKTLDDDGNEIFLSTLDGPLSASINLDVLEFQAQGYNIYVLSDALTFEQFSNSSVIIYYRNSRDDVTSASLAVYRVSTGALLFSESAFTNPNDWTYYYDYSTLTGIDDNTQFKVVLTIVRESGKTESIVKYFTARGGGGYLDPRLAFALSLIILIAALTTFSGESTYGWFGAIVLLLSLGVTATSTSTWYLMMLQGIELIIFVFVVVSFIKTREGSLV